MTTPYSGDGKGHLFTPEVGSQVLVNYEHGLPGFPVVVGNVFHPQNKQGTQYSPPSNNLKGLQGGRQQICDGRHGVPQQKAPRSDTNQAFWLLASLCGTCFSAPGKLNSVVLPA